LKIFGHLGAFRWLRRPFALQFQHAADDSLLCAEQRISSPRTGKFFAETGKFLRQSVSRHRLIEADSIALFLR
jgi:hypothetical protein